MLRVAHGKSRIIKLRTSLKQKPFHDSLDCCKLGVRRLFALIAPRAIYFFSVSYALRKYTLSPHFHYEKGLAALSTGKMGKDEGTIQIHLASAEVNYGCN